MCYVARGKTWLAANGIDTLYQCSGETYDAGKMRADIGQGTVFLMDHAPAARRNRERNLALRMVADFPGNRIVFLPGRIGPNDDGFLAALTATAKTAGSDLVVFASTQTARDHLAGHFGPAMAGDLIPDLALMLGQRTKPADPRYDVVWLARTDAEGRDAETEAGGQARLASGGEIRASSLFRSLGPQLRDQAPAADRCAQRLAGALVASTPTRKRALRSKALDFDARARSLSARRADHFLAARSSRHHRPELRRACPGLAIGHSAYPGEHAFGMER